MKFQKFKASFATVIFAAAIAWAAPALASEPLRRDGLESLRSDVKANRTAVIAQEMQFTQHESDEFWPIYRAYRSEVDKATDQVVELVLEYTDQYPGIPEEKAREMLEQYLKVEAQLVKLKEKYLKKIGKVIPATKVFRFAQLDNRLDLATRVGMASAIPILGTDKAAPAKQN